jgi:hypothetical protein
MTNPRTDKRFDCVEMKNQAQRRLLAKFEGLSPAEEVEAIHSAVEAGPFADWWRSLADDRPPPPSAAFVGPGPTG